MRDISYSAARVQDRPPLPEPLAATYEVFALLSHIRYALVDAKIRAEDGSLDSIANRIGWQIAIVDQLLPDVTATAKSLEAAAKAVKR
jgi:hypothetical protein